MEDPLDPNESENKCFYVTSRGIAKSCKQHPVFFDGNKYSLKLSYNVSYGDSVYIPYQFFIYFLSQQLHLFNNPIVLVVGDDDNTFPIDFDPNILKFIENNDKIIKLYCQNCTITTEKIHNIPIGIYYHTMCYKTDYNSNPISPLVQEYNLLQILKKFKPLTDTNLKCVTNFHHSLDMPKRTGFRLPALQILKDKNFMIWLPRQTRDEFWSSLNDNAFVVCPPGNGIDTHRLWEALVFNRIPITFDTGLTVYNDLPVIQLSDWNTITEEWLQQQFIEVCSKLENGEYNMNKITLKYWSDIINNY
jgi:hypothetical protein